jgi:hypothetical protein
MASSQFQSMLYRTRREMLDAIAHEWLTAGGLNTPDIVADINDSDVDLAAECIKGWGLDQTGEHHFDDGPEPSHMVEHDYDADDLAGAFSRVRNA